MQGATSRYTSNNHCRLANEGLVSHTGCRCCVSYGRELGSPAPTHKIFPTFLPVLLNLQDNRNGRPKVIMYQNVN